MSTPSCEKLKPWANAVASNWTNASQAVILSDMSACGPGAALSTTAKRGCWSVFPYEADPVCGKMIWANEDAAAPPVTLDLPVTGWYAIFVGLYSTRHTPGRVWLKLDDDPAPVPRGSKPKVGYWTIQEQFFKVAELKGRSLVIAQQPAGEVLGAGVAYVKLVPMTESEVSGYLADREEKPAHGLVATCDGFSFFCARRPTTAEDVLAEIELFGGTGVNTLVLEQGGAEMTNYPSKNGGMFGEGVDTYPCPIYRHGAESVRELARQGINPTTLLIDRAHELGMRVLIGLRPAGWTYYEPFASSFRSTFYAEHPEWRTVDYDGTPIARMSWAVPEVRRHVIDLLRETVQLGGDGAHIIFNRGWPMVLFEPPFRKLFVEKHGCDPLELPEDDPRTKDLQCEVVATFLREVRAMLDEEAARRGDERRLNLSVCILGIEEDNLKYSFDLRRIVAEGLIDEVIPYKYGFGESKRVYDMAWFNEVCGPKNIPVQPLFSPGCAPDDCMDEAIELLENGAAGVGFWDAFNDDIGAWTVRGRFNRLDEMKQRRDLGPEEQEIRLHVHSVGEGILDARYPIFWCG